TMVSQATRACLSWAMMASSTASEIWSAILSGCPSDTDSEVNRAYSLIGNSYSFQGLLRVRLGKMPQLNLKAVLEAQVQALTRDKPSGAGPAGQIFLFEAQPEIAAGRPGPALVVAAQLADQETAAAVHQRRQS